MSKLPEKLIQSLEGIEGFDKEAFIEVHQRNEQVTSVRLNPLKCTSEELNDPSLLLTHYSSLIEPVPWSRYGYYLSKRPSFTFDPLFHAGCYYVQEASSMFLEQALRQTVDLSQPVKVLDLCAAPGGKSTHLQSLINSQSLLVSNEVIRPRASILTQNIMKWGCSNVVVTNNDPQHFGRIPGFFDVIVVDAPCSGSGLFRRDEEAIKEWSLDNVQLCYGRQKRILADVLPALKEGGVLIYSTCSYSRVEDEEVMEWLVREMGLEPSTVDSPRSTEESPRTMVDGPRSTVEDWGIVKAHGGEGIEGYRFYPYRVKGEGFFIACFRKKRDDGGGRYKSAKPELVSAKEKEIIKNYLKGDEWSYLRFREEMIGVPEHLVNDFSVLQASLNLLYAGVVMGQVMKERLVPHHALALCSHISPDIISTELSYEQAIKYLQRGDLNIETMQTGWQTVSFHNHNLGWINSLKNRVNNYYPKEFRILKQSNDAASKN